MKGLLYKDFQLLRNSYSRNILTVLLLYAAIILLTRQIFVAYALVFLAGVYVSSTISFDEQAHWDSYARTLPVSAGQIVAAKYLLNLVFMLAAAVCALLLSALLPLSAGIAGDAAAVPLPEQLSGILGSGAVSLLASSLTLPISYKFGGARVRSFVSTAFLALFVLGFLLMRSLPAGFMHDTIAALNAVSEQQVRLWVVLIFAALLALYAASGAVCVRIYKNNAR